MFSIEYRYFFQAAKDLSIRKASGNLNVNSSAVVRQIKKLEANLDCKIFYRHTRGITLTKEGEFLFNYMEKAINSSKEFYYNLKEQKNRIEGTINIGMIESLGAFYTAPILEDYQNKYPDIKYNILAKKPEGILDGLIEGNIDIGLTFTENLPKSCKIFYEKNFPIGILSSPDHILQSKERVILDDCFKFPLIFHTGAVTYFKRVQRDLGIMHNYMIPKIITNSNAMIRRYLINSSTTLAIATIIGGLDEVMNGLIKFREIDDVVMKNNKMGIVVLKNKKFKEYEINFLSYLKNSFNFEKFNYPY